VAKDIDTYLKELQAALTAAGADRALVQDALFDAEEYLRTEMAERYEAEAASVEEYQTRFVAVIDGYGSPEEVAAAYLGAPREGAAAADGAAASPGAAAEGAPASEVAPVPLAPRWGAAPSAGGGPARPGAWRQVFGVVVDPAFYKALLYMLISLVTGIAYFTIVVTGVSVSAGASVLIVGIPLFLLVLGTVRAMSLVESRLVEELLGTRMPRRERAELPEAGWLQRVLYWVKDRRTWASMAYMMLMLPLGVAYFTIAVTGLSVGLGLIVSPFFDTVRLSDLFINHVSYHFALPAWSMPLVVLSGLIILLLWMHLVRLLGRGHAALAKNMLVCLTH
jgi:hypothetical protein